MTDCLFCRIVRKEIPATIVAEDAQCIAFRDINAQAPTHVLVVPKSHHATVGDLARDAPDVLADVVNTAAQVAEREDLGAGYRLVFNTGAQAGQTVFHVHGHVLGGRAMTWPPG